MIKNYLKIAWRNLLRNKTFSLINILGLSIGVATCLLIFFYVQYELSYDSHHAKKDRIVRITGTFKTPDGDVRLAVSPSLLTEELKRSFPEIENAVRLKPMEPVVEFNNDHFREEHFFSADQTVFDVFDFDFKEGSKKDALVNPKSIVLTETVAKKYFGNSPAVGQTMKIDKELWNVTAVIKNPPTNADIKIRALRSVDFTKVTNWTQDDFDVYTFALFKGVPELKSFSTKLNDISVRLIQPELDQQDAKEYHVLFELQQLKDVHYTNGLLNDMGKGSKQINYMFSLLAVFILVIALFNYINLSTAKATERAKEVGVRKVNGAMRWQLVRQFLFESFLLILAAWAIAITVALLVLPLFNRLLETGIQFSFKQHATFMVLAFLLTILLAGLYPAFVLSGFKPVEILKGKWRHSSSGVFLRKSLTVVQFVLTACLITGAIVIYTQMRYVAKKDLGFNVKNIINLDIESDSVSQQNAKVLVNELRSIFGAENISAGGGIQGEGMAMGTTFVETENGKKRELMSSYQFVDKEFIPFYGITVKEGRNLSDSLATDKTSFIVNEAYVANMKWKTALGKNMDGFGRKGKVIGVVKNYYYESLKDMIKPTILLLTPRIMSSIAIKAEPKDLPRLTQLWKKYFPALPIDYEFIDEAYAEKYQKDRTTQTLFTFFTVLAIFISMMGLYGLVSLMAVHRSKEIGVRKVLGASLPQLLSILSKGFVRLIIIASVIAVPLSWYAMHYWLQDYAYHINLSWWMFTIPVILIVIVALLVIAKQVFTAATANPVKALRSE